MATLGLALMAIGGLLIYWAIGGGSLDLTSGKPKATSAAPGVITA